MTEFPHNLSSSKRLVGVLLASIVAALLSSCTGEPPAETKIEQVRQRHNDTMGYPVKITYELGTNWVSEKWGRYSMAGIPADEVSLTVEVDSARVHSDNFEDRLKELRKPPKHRRDRQIMTAQVITFDGQDAMEFAMRQESSRNPGVYRVLHRFEFFRGDYYIEIRLNTPETYYERYIEQLKHTAASVRLVTDE